jgi:hypothetical protein
MCQHGRAALFQAWSCTVPHRELHAVAVPHSALPAAGVLGGAPICEEGGVRESGSSGQQDVSLYFGTSSHLPLQHKGFRPQDALLVVRPPPDRRIRPVAPPTRPLPSATCTFDELALHTLPLLPLPLVVAAILEGHASLACSVGGGGQWAPRPVAAAPCRKPAAYAIDASEEAPDARAPRASPTVEAGHKGLRRLWPGSLRSHPAWGTHR